ncbi:MAG: sigma-70 family RNA polymerase sigma factor [Chloroflexota bacterium]
MSEDYLARSLTNNLQSVSTPSSDPPPPLHDQQLMIRVKSGDQAALELLYDQYASNVMGIAMRVVGDRVVAEEIVQEVFLRIWRNAHLFESQRGTVSNWVFGITRNLSIDMLRRQTARPQAALIEYDQVGNGDGADPDVTVAETAWTTIKYNQVRTALATLPSAQRNVIELAYFKGLTRQEIAEQFDIPLGTVHTRARLALQKLRTILREQGFEE